MLTPPQIPTFTIVTPSLNAGRFINSTIASVVSQCGRFRVRYHVQDGGSSDNTISKLEAWSERLTSGFFQPECHGVDFSYSTAPDHGMYDAIQAGFVHCGINPSDYQTWINSDDILMPGALSCVAKLFREFPEVLLLGGRPCEMDEDGVLMRLHDLQLYPRCTLAAGLHDGRHLPFVMQEGTFWKAELWLKTGGVRRDLRLAGDFDLWRRFASETSYVSVDTVLAAHRRCAGQLSENSAAYYAELDSSMETHAVERDRIWEQHQQWHARSAGDRDRSFCGTRLSWESGHWEMDHRSVPAFFNTTICITAEGTQRSLPAEYISGFWGERDPYPHSGIPKDCRWLNEGSDLHIPRGSRWFHDGVAVIRFTAQIEAPHCLKIRLRSFSDRTVMTIKHRSRKLFEGALPLTFQDRDCEISAVTEFEQGPNTIALFLDPPQPERRPGILITACEAVPVA